MLNLPDFFSFACLVFRNQLTFEIENMQKQNIVYMINQFNMKQKQVHAQFLQYRQIVIIFIIHFCYINSCMIVEDVEIMPNSLSQVFQDPEQRKRILKIIIQTLYNLGYQQSAAELETESKISYFTPQIKSIKQALAQQKYQTVQKILEQSKKYNIVRDIINQLKCFRMIKEGKMQDALNLIQNQIKQPKKQEQLSEQLMMGTGQLKQQVLKKKHDYILQKCFDIDICPNSMFKMINSYIQLQKRGLTNGISPQFSLLRKPSTSRRPPMRIAQTATSAHIKSISFIKFNRNQKKILVVGGSKKQKSLSIWNLNKQKQSINESKHSNFILDQEVACVNWGYEHSQQSQLIAVATHNSIFVFSNQLKIKHKKKISNGMHHSSKILCLNWNPLTNFLYVGGSFENIKVYGSSLDQIVTIQPFIRTRSVCFNTQGTFMYAVSATKGLFILYNLFQYKQEAQFITEDVITSFRLQNKDRNIVLVTEKKILYISVQSEKQYKYTILFTFDNVFSQNGLIEIQACLFNPWIVYLGQKQFQAVALDKSNNRQQKWNSKNSFTFDIAEGFMVSGSKQIILWTSGNFQDVMEDQHESEIIQIQENNKRMVEQQESEQEQNQEGDDSSQIDIQEEENEQF